MHGKMLWFNEEKDRGQIEADDGERLEVRGDQFAAGWRPEGRCGGTPVSFAVADGTAFNVTLVPEVLGQRARRRTRS